MSKRWLTRRWTHERVAKADGSKLDESKEVVCVFLKLLRNVPTVLHPVEEPITVISMTVEIRTEADRIAPVPTGWDVRPAST